MAFTKYPSDEESDSDINSENSYIPDDEELIVPSEEYESDDLEDAELAFEENLMDEEDVPEEGRQQPPERGEPRRQGAQPSTSQQSSDMGACLLYTSRCV